ncbi:hypothetical protein CHELA17_40004 [Chelatococcus asaccharovorans]|nr:hypothetical protein CHELA17_40004 [Chelatococcus asaccharovorans]
MTPSLVAVAFRRSTAQRAYGKSRRLDRDASLVHRCVLVHDHPPAREPSLWRKELHRDPCEHSKGEAHDQHDKDRPIKKPLARLDRRFNGWILSRVIISTERRDRIAAFQSLGLVRCAQFGVRCHDMSPLGL